MQQSARSIDVLSDEVHEQLATQLGHFESLDAKAGVLLGFAGLFVVFAPDTGNALVGAARVAGVVSAAASLLTFMLRRYPAVDLVPLRENYLAAEPAFTRLRLLDTHMAILERGHGLIDRKVRRLTVAVGSLLVAIVLASMGVLVGFQSGGSL